MGAVTQNKPRKSRHIGTILIVLGIIVVLVGVGIYIYKRLENFFEIQESTRVVGLLTDAISSTPDADDSMTIDGKEYIGIIELPSLNMTLPVLASCEGDNLEKGICLYASNGNYVIGGHNRESQFGRIYNLKINDKLIFYDTHSNKKEYALAKTEYLLPENVEQFTTNEYGITLFTCTWDNRQRYVLRFR